MGRRGWGGRGGEERVGRKGGEEGVLYLLPVVLSSYQEERGNIDKEEGWGERDKEEGVGSSPLNNYHGSASREKMCTKQ